MSVEPFVWDESYNVGIRRMDEDHRGIIKMINALITAEQPPEVGSETVSDLLNALTQYAIDHFEREENLLREHRYPELASQQRQHREYRKRVAALCVDTVSGKDTVPSELLVFLLRWWKDHILEDDMKYGGFLRERGVR